MSHCQLESGFARHPKTLRLAAIIGVDRQKAMGIVADLWCWVMETRPSGILDGIAYDEIEIAVDWRGERGALARAFISCGWLDEHSDGTLELHEWIERASSYRKARVDKKHRDAKRRARVARESNSRRTHDREERRGEEKKGDQKKKQTATFEISPPNKPDEPVVGSLSCSNGQWSLTETLAEKLRAAFPAVDIGRQLVSADAWCASNPSDRPTVRGASRFFHAWCRRTQDGRASQASMRPTVLRPTATDAALTLMADGSDETAVRAQRMLDARAAARRGEQPTQGALRLPSTTVKYVARSPPPRHESKPPGPWSIEPAPLEEESKPWA